MNLPVLYTFDFLLIMTKGWKNGFSNC